MWPCQQLQMSLLHVGVQYCSATVLQCSKQNAVKSVGRSAMQCTYQLPQATLALICSDHDMDAIALN